MSNTDSYTDYRNLEQFLTRPVEEKLVSETKGVRVYSLNVSLAEMELYKSWLALRTSVQLVCDDRDDHHILKTISGDIPILKRKLIDENEL